MKDINYNNFYLDDVFKNIDKKRKKKERKEQREYVESRRYRPEDRTDKLLNNADELEKLMFRYEYIGSVYIKAPN